jgi:tetratricopeptide (TPR) repeat protein
MSWLLLAALLAQSPPPAAPDQPPPTTRARALAQHQHGVALFDQGDYQGALAAFENVYRLVPGPKLLFNIGQANLALGRSAEALDDFEQFLKLAPNAAPEHLDVARRAVADLTAALSQRAAPAPAPVPAPANLAPTSPEGTATPAAAIAPHPRLTQPDLEALTDAPRPATPPEVQPRFWISLLAGTGYGWTTGTGDIIVERPDPSGFAWAQLGHLQPTLGYYLDPTLVIALAGRLQRVTGATPIYGVPDGICGGDHVCEAPKAAAAVLVKAIKFTDRPSARLRTYYSLAAGLGTIRHVAPSHQLLICGSSRAEMCADSYPAGPVLAGPGVGVVFKIVGGLGLALSPPAQN